MKIVDAVLIPIRYEGEPNIFTLSEPEVLLDKEFIFRVIALLSAASHLIGIIYFL